MPLMISLPGQMLRIHSTSFQLRAVEFRRGPFASDLTLLHALYVAGEIAEGPALAGQHAAIQRGLVAMLTRLRI